MVTVALRIWIHKGYRVAERIMYELERETHRDLDLLSANADGLYYFVCKEQFPDFLEGAHNAADHLAVNLPHVYKNGRPDFQIVFKDDTNTLGWTTPLSLAVRLALQLQEKDRLIAELVEKLQALDLAVQKDKAIPR